MMSPSRTAAMGPPTNASGATWPAVNPRVAPEKRPSVSRATCALSSALDEMAAVTCNISRMPGPPFGTLIADHEHIAGLDSAFLDGSETGFFCIEDAGWPAMFHPIGSGNLHHATFRREIAFENNQPTRRLDWLVECVNDNLSRCFLGKCCFFGQCAAANGECGPIRESRIDQALCQHT